jgi:hypothetical protein
MLMPLFDVAAAQTVNMMLMRRTTLAAEAVAKQPPRQPLHLFSSTETLCSRWEPCDPDRRNHHKNRAQPFLTARVERLLNVLNAGFRPLCDSGHLKRVNNLIVLPNFETLLTCGARYRHPYRPVLYPYPLVGSDETLEDTEKRYVSFELL